MNITHSLERWGAWVINGMQGVNPVAEQVHSIIIKDLTHAQAVILCVEFRVTKETERLRTRQDKAYYLSITDEAYRTRLYRAKRQLEQMVFEKYGY